jgi:hypothetical protein
LFLGRSRYAKDEDPRGRSLVSAHRGGFNKTRSSEMMEDDYLPASEEEDPKPTILRFISSVCNLGFLKEVSLQSCV